MGYMLTVVVAAGWVSFWDYFATEKKALIKKVKLKQTKDAKKSFMHKFCKNKSPFKNKCYFLNSGTSLVQATETEQMRVWQLIV